MANNAALVFAAQQREHSHFLKGQAMAGKHFGWHKAWSRTSDGSIKHTSGLIMTVHRGDGYTDLIADDASLDAAQAHELARGVKPADMQARMMRLTREAAQWHERNQ